MSETSVSFGGRLDYYNSKCNDIWAAILFYCTIIAFIVSTVYFYVCKYVFILWINIIKLKNGLI